MITQVSLTEHSPFSNQAIGLPTIYCYEHKWQYQHEGECAKCFEKKMSDLMGKPVHLVQVATITVELQEG
jgi:phenylpropionate dioxygenase-like ring-hydroxylating dioxygenase large terminal subunit